MHYNHKQGLQTDLEMQSSFALSTTRAAIFFKSSSTCDIISIPTISSCSTTILIHKANCVWVFLVQKNNIIPGMGKPIEEVAVGLEWTMIRLKGGFGAAGTMKRSNVHSRAKKLCSLSSTPTTITGFVVVNIVVLLLVCVHLSCWITIQ